MVSIGIYVAVPLIYQLTVSDQKHWGKEEGGRLSPPMHTSTPGVTQFQFYL